jgi:hypothetical protein
MASGYRTAGCQMKPLGDRPHALYRFYDTTGALLYVGITVDAPRRFGRHSEDKPWWLEVARIDMEPFPDRDSVLVAERAAIQSEAPRYNIAHARGTQSAPTRYTPWRFAETPAQIPDVYQQVWNDVGAHWLGMVGAFALADGACPVGLVTSSDRHGLELDLFSFMSGYFSAGTRRIRWRDLRQFEVAELLPEHEARRRGYLLEPGDVIWDMEPLGSFQSAWKATHV